MSTQTRVEARKAASVTGNLLCVANFPTNTGYAWDFIESLYAGVADALAPAGVQTWVAYPEVKDEPHPLRGSTAKALELSVRLTTPGSIVKVVAEIRRKRIRTLYLSDRASWSLEYAMLRLAGVRTIVVHDHTSGERTPPCGIRRLVKQLTRAFRPALADVVLAVSEYVGRRKVRVDLVPEGRVRVIPNSVHIPDRVEQTALHRTFGLEADRPVVACVGRAAEYKGIQHLLRAFDALSPDVTLLPPVLIYMGDGPYMPTLQAVAESLHSRDRILLPGYVPGAADLLGGADVCAVPSLWAEAFGLAALEPAARGVPVVASRMGGLPEVVVDGETGLLVPAGDEAALAAALEQLFRDPGRRKAMGEAARQRAMDLFNWEDQLEALVGVFTSRMLGQSVSQPMSRRPS